MVYLHFPSNLTDEELMLQAKYIKLRKKKKALEQMKVPKQEPEKINPLKRQLDPKDAKELAKKLIQSGKVSIPLKQTIEKTTFKRPRTLERKILSTGRSEGHGGLTPGYSANYPANDSIQFEPFTPHADENKIDSPSESSDSFNRFSPDGGPSDINNRSIIKAKTFLKKTHKPHSSMKEHTHQSFGNSPGGGGGGGSGMMAKGQNKPKRGPTIYIQAHNITEDILRQQFGKFGKIVNVKLHSQSVGFVTFDKLDFAEHAIQEMNGIAVDDISYDVQFARRQPTITQLINDASASASWTALATSHSQKSGFKDKRSQVVYDDPLAD